jgi:hypothetical protein
VKNNNEHMKRILIISLILIIKFTYAQSIEDIGRISIGCYLPDNTPNLPLNSRDILLSKLLQIVTTNGIASDGIGKRFIITATINPTTKDIIAGPPQQVAQNIDLTVIIGDAVEGIKFESITLSLKGVGTNTDKATIDAINKINASADKITTFVTKGKQKIISYYQSNCHSIQQRAKALAVQQKYGEAIAALMEVPSVVGECYASCLELSSTIFKEQQEHTCKQTLFEAQAKWAAQQDVNTAIAVSAKLSFINHQTPCSNDVLAFMTTVKNKLLADEKVKLEQEMKRYEDERKYKDAELNAMKEIALEQIKNQPKTLIYNNIYWK